VSKIPVSAKFIVDVGVDAACSAKMLGITDECLRDLWKIKDLDGLAMCLCVPNTHLQNAMITTVKEWYKNICEKSNSAQS
jgi:hypothetical protein